ncbi:MAG: GNAT family N-acetyltransferase [Alphaproteobacteria bacterium]|nr:MAG: GNAT family N-acetyltransferase [Alphaproteobacteria bacterium]
MTIDVKIKPVTEQDYDPAQFALLLKKSRSEGLNLILRLTENWESGTNRFNKPGEAFFAAEHEGRYLAVGGRSLDPYLKDPSVLRVRHVYVLPEWRRLGIAKKLMEKIMDVPEGPFRKLTLRTLNPGARKFYEHLGFNYVGEGDVTHELQL